MFQRIELKTKQQYRTQARKLRSALDILAVSNEICSKLSRINLYQKAKTVAGYHPFNNEIDITPLYADCSKEWYLPQVIDNEKMTFYSYTNKSCMKKNRFGILEPFSEKEINIENLDMVIVPGLMADKNGYRLGYGKGYYDRFLSKIPETCIKILPIASELTVDKLPHDEFDIKVDVIITQHETYFLEKTDLFNPNL